MTTLALITAFPPSAGSLNEYGYHLAIALIARPDVDRLIILADQIEGGSQEMDLPDGIEVRRCWRFNDLLTPFKLALESRKLGADGVIFNLQTASFGDREVPAALGLFAPALTRLFGTRSGVIAHNLIDAIDVEKTAVGDNALRAKLIRLAGKIVTRALLKASYVTVTLDGFSDLLEGNYKATNAYMVPHGTFPAASFEVLSIVERDMTVCTMGKFGTYKKLGRLIEAFELVQDRHPATPMTLRIGGTDHPAADGYLERLQRRCETNTRIEFIGYVAEEDVADFFASSRLAVFDYETTTGSSGVLHQASGFGTPAAYPLIDDFVDVTEREGLAGYHYDAFDRVSLANAIEAALLDPVRAQNMALANLAVSGALPMSLVAGFHVRMLTTSRHRRRDIALFQPASHANPSMA